MPEVESLLLVLLALLTNKETETFEKRNLPKVTPVEQLKRELARGLCYTF